MKTWQIGKGWLVVLLLCSGAVAQQNVADGKKPVALTIYNQDFAVVRTSVDLDLKAGRTEATTTEVTRRLEPDSVILRDAAGKHAFTVLEQNYDGAVVSQEWMLTKYEGQTLEFQQMHGDRIDTVKGKILRAQPPLIEVEGKMQFLLPGTPLFPASTDGLLLKPTLSWQLQSEKAARFLAELSFVTEGFGWQATYNVVASAQQVAGSGSEPMDVVGWVTVTNSSGADFPAARIQLMAGNVAKIMQPKYTLGRVMANSSMAMGAGMAAQAVTQESFDDFHLYDLNRTTALRDGETKQIEFLHARQVPVLRKYEFDGYPGFSSYANYGDGYHNTSRSFGLEARPVVRLVSEFKNSEENHLGMPLPAGLIRMYREDKAGQMQFIGESRIEHSPKNETIRIVTGSAFDVTGKRRQTEFHVDSARRIIDESFEVELKNAKDQPAKVDVLEHLYRAANWEITAKSGEFIKNDSATIRFPATVPANGSVKVTYTVHYTW